MFLGLKARIMTLRYAVLPNSNIAYTKDKLEWELDQISKSSAVYPIQCAHDVTLLTLLVCSIWYV